MQGPRSLQGRLLALILSLVCGVWVATAVLTWRDVSRELDELLDSHLAQAASLLVAQQSGEIEDTTTASTRPRCTAMPPRWHSRSFTRVGWRCARPMHRHSRC